MTTLGRVEILEQLKASQDALKVAEILSARGVPEERALRLGELVVTMTDPAMYDAAIWSAAERLAYLLEPRAEHEALRELPARIRQLHLVSAMHAIRSFEGVLTGLKNGDQVQQLYADYMTHRDQVMAATTGKRLEFAREQ